jgi:hypothetical protein
MRLRSIAVLLPLLGITASSFAAEKLRVLALDTAVVRADTGFAATAARLYAPEAPDSGLGAIVAQAFHPRFADAVTRAARRVVVAPAKDTGSRYTLRIDSLALSTRSRATGRRFVPPSPPEYDPATGEMSPGDRSGRMEGPGWTGTLSAVARWTLWDRAGDSALARGTSTGTSTYRGEAGRGDVDRAARELAKAVLRATPFSP